MVHNSHSSGKILYNRLEILLQALLLPVVLHLFSNIPHIFDVGRTSAPIRFPELCNIKPSLILKGFLPQHIFIIMIHQFTEFTGLGFSVKHLITLLLSLIFFLKIRLFQIIGIEKIKAVLLYYINIVCRFLCNTPEQLNFRRYSGNQNNRIPAIFPAVQPAPFNVIMLLANPEIGFQSYPLFPNFPEYLLCLIPVTGTDHIQSIMCPVIPKFLLRAAIQLGNTVCTILKYIFSRILIVPGNTAVKYIHYFI